MGENTKIAWCDHTFNAWVGCSHVSPACDHCYAEDMMDRRYGTVRWGPGQPRLRTGKANWQQPRGWNRRAIREGTRPFVFCLSLGDIWDNEVDPQWRADLFDLIRETPALVWLLLSKRIGNAVKMAREAGGLPGNCALGATFANQDEYDRDIAKLWDATERLIPLFNFGSFEPLLGPIRLGASVPDWTIVGGESGPQARTMDLRWARDMLDETRPHNSTFFFKQVGGPDAKKGGDRLDGELYQARPTILPYEAAS